MSDITITDGLPEAWTLANSDKLKLDEANLINLAVGQLALLGASQGTNLRAQTLELKKLVNSVETVNTKLESLNTANSWAGTTVDLGFPAESIGWTIPSTSTLSTTDLSLINKMISASSTMNSLKISYGGSDAFKYTLVSGGTSRELISRTVLGGSITGNTSGPLPLTNVSTTNGTPSSLISQGQLFFLTDSTGSSNWFVYDSGSVVKLPAAPDIQVTNFFAIPQTNTELQSWQIQAPGNTAGLSSVQIALSSTASLSSDVVLAPNTLPAPNPPITPPPTNAVTMAIDTGAAYDMAEYTLSNNLKVYAPYPPTQVAQFDTTTQAVLANVGKVFQVGATTVMVTADSFGRVTNTNVTKTTPFFYKPTTEQMTSWRSQYAEKIILITQRSSDQQLFVNRLAQKYQYSFDAATYVLKAFTAMLSTAANNV